MEFDDIISRERRLELEKEILGGNIYFQAHKFPSIYVTKKENNEEYCCDIEYFLNITQLLKRMMDAFGRDLSFLFAELCNLYEIDKEKDSNDPTIKNFIITFYPQAIGYISLALNQSEKLLEKFSNEMHDEKIIEAQGKEYCFIPIALTGLLQYYSQALHLLSLKKYFNNEFIGVASERFSFLVSEEFDALRKMFKCVECFESMEDKPTIH